MEDTKRHAVTIKTYVVECDRWVGKKKYKLKLSEICRPDASGAMYLEKWELKAGDHQIEILPAALPHVIKILSAP